MKIKRNSEALLTRVKREVVVSRFIPGEGKALDIGCRDGRYTKYLKHLDLVSTDIDARDLKKIKKQGHGKFVVADVQKMPFKPNTFDFVLFTEVLEHVPDQEKALKEIARVLKKNGRVILTTPNAKYPFVWDPMNWLREKSGKKPKRKNSIFTNWTPDHKHLFNYKELKTEIGKNLKVEKVIASGRVFTPFLQALWFPVYGIVKGFRKARLGFISKGIEKIFWGFMRLSVWEDSEKDVPSLTLIVVAKKA